MSHLKKVRLRCSNYLVFDSCNYLPIWIKVVTDICVLKKSKTAGLSRINVKTLKLIEKDSSNLCLQMIKAFWILGLDKPEAPGPVPSLKDCLIDDDFLNPIIYLMNFCFSINL